MSQFRVRDGNVTATLSFDEEALIRQVIEQVSSGMLSTMEAGCEEVAAEARKEWYAPGTGVQRETGKSGDIQVVTTVDLDRGQLRVSVGSADTRTTEKGKPMAVYIHRPGVGALIKKSVTHAEYYAQPKKLRANYKPDQYDVAEKRGTGPFIWVVSPYASDGKFLIAELLRKKMKARLATMLPALRASITQQLARRN